MNRQILASTMGLSAVLGAGALLMPAVGQAPAAAQKTPAKAATPAAKAALAKAWTLPRTPDGQPEIGGYWTNNTFTPLERPNGVTKEFYTKEEAEADERKRMAQEADAEAAPQTAPGTTADVHYDFRQFGLNKAQGSHAVNLRTSLIIDPPDGHIPARTAEFTARQNARRAPRGQGATYDTVKNIPIGSRCIIGGIGQPIPMLPQGYNSNYQIVQGLNAVMILYENIGDVRIVYLDNRPAPPKEVTQWMGVSRGHWEGDTLIVETTNFNERLEGRAASLAGVSSDFKLIERFRRAGPDEMLYEAVINDPSSYAKPWTAQVPFAKMEGPIFEPACHEGNYGIANTLAGARLEEAKAAANPQSAAPAAARGGGGAGAGGGAARGGGAGGGARGGGGAGGATGAPRGGNQ